MLLFEAHERDFFILRQLSFHLLLFQRWPQAKVKSMTELCRHAVQIFFFYREFPAIWWTRKPLIREITKACFFFCFVLFSVFFFLYSPQFLSRRDIQDGG